MSTDAACDTLIERGKRPVPRPVDVFALRVVDRLAETLVVVALFVELALVLANVLARGLFQHSFLWSDEVARLALSIIAFVGGAVAYRRREHAQVRVILRMLPPRAERVCLALADSVALCAATLT